MTVSKTWIGLRANFAMHICWQRTSRLQCIEAGFLECCPSTFWCLTSNAEHHLARRELRAFLGGAAFGRDLQGHLVASETDYTTAIDLLRTPEVRLEAPQAVPIAMTCCV